MSFEHHFAGWVVVEKLGEGGMCAVYRAHREGEPATQRALKVLVDRDITSVPRFLEEARLLAMLQHPNILDVEEVVAADPPWMVMQLLTGRDLEAARDAGDAIDPLQAARWIAEIADGLQVAHDAGIVHRDIKPNNIMLGNDGRARLIDFGIARDVREHHRTRKGVVVGTAAYLPPEVYLTDNAKALQDSPRADVYALGQTLAEVLIGEPVHPLVEGPKMLVTIMRDKIARDAIDPRSWNPHVPAALAEIVIHATRQDPNQRLATAAALALALRAFCEKSQQPAPAPVSPTSAALTLPAPPTPSQAPTASMTPATPDAPVLFVAPPPTRSSFRAALGAASMVGLAALGILTGGGLLFATLYTLRPDPVNRLGTRQVLAALTPLRGAIGTCVRSSHELVVDVRGGRVIEWRAQTATPAEWTCLQPVLSDLAVVDAPDGTFRVPMHVTP